MNNIQSDTELFVSNIVEINKKKRLVYINYEKAFPLYIGELRKYGIKKDNYISEEIFDEIITQVLPKRAKLRVMSLLKTRDMTEHELVQKLKDGYYPETSIEAAIEYVRGYGYINDLRYAENYVMFHGETKSKMQIYTALNKKGIDKEIINEVCSSFYDNGEVELEQIIKLIEKRRVDLSNMDMQEKNKLYGYLARRGFGYEAISKAVSIKMDREN